MDNPKQNSKKIQTGTPIQIPKTYLRKDMRQYLVCLQDIEMVGLWGHLVDCPTCFAEHMEELTGL